MTTEPSASEVEHMSFPDLIRKGRYYRLGDDQTVFQRYYCQ